MADVQKLKVSEMSNRYKSTWYQMRELIILSLNIIYIKDTIQQLERGIKTRLLYINQETGPVDAMIYCLQARKHSLNKRMKFELEDLMNSKKDDSNFAFNVEVDHASLTRKQLLKGYALFTNVRDITYALDLRSGVLLPITHPELNVTDPNMAGLEYTARHEGGVYKYFEIDPTDPLKNELRY